MIGETVIRIRATTSTDRYDDQTPGEPVELSIDGALFAPNGLPENPTMGRAPVIDQPALYWVRQRPDIVVSDRIRVRGLEYQVDGDPDDWRSGFGGDAGGLVVKLKRVSG